MKKKIVGYIVHGNKYGPLGTCSSNVPEALKNILWSGGSGWMVTLFKTKLAAKKAITATERYAMSEGFDKGTYPIWFTHHIEPVREA